METNKSYGYRLLEKLPQGTKLCTILRHVSRSGMTRVMDVFLIEGNSSHPIRVPELSGYAQGYDTMRKWGGDYKVSGYGMDMGFDLVYRLGQLVHQDGYYFKQEWL